MSLIIVKNKIVIAKYLKRTTKELNLVLWKIYKKLFFRRPPPPKNLFFINHVGNTDLV